MFVKFWVLKKKVIKSVYFFKYIFLNYIIQERKFWTSKWTPRYWIEQLQTVTGPFENLCCKYLIIIKEKKFFILKCYYDLIKLILKKLLFFMWETLVFFLICTGKLSPVTTSLSHSWIHHFMLSIFVLYFKFLSFWPTPVCHDLYIEDVNCKLRIFFVYFWQKAFIPVCLHYDT